jgi:hypothetical protein
VSRVFISYRREDTAGHAGRLFDKLEDHFGPDQIFIDLELEPGVDYLSHIQETTSRCDALLVVIGPRWTIIEGPSGERRLDAPEDLVRTEVETALRTDTVTAIPVLVQGATMPQSEQLPPSLRALVRRNALEISDRRFEYDTTRLIEVLQPLTAPALDGDPSSDKRKRAFGSDPVSSPRTGPGRCASPRCRSARTGSRW